jgi:hypothetical protein
LGGPCLSRVGLEQLANAPSASPGMLEQR